MPPENDLQKIANEHLAAESDKLTPLTPPAEHDPNSPLKQIRTFQGDVAEILEKQKESLFSIQQKEAAQQQARQVEATQEERVTPVVSGQRVVPSSPDTTGKNYELFLLLLGSIVLIVLGLAGAWYGYQTFLKQSRPPEIVVPETRFIAVQSAITIDATTLNRANLIGEIDSQLGDVKDGELRQAVFKKGTTTLSSLLTTGELFQKLQTQAPGSLVRALDPLFMFGSLGQSRFFIIKITSFENAFPGMLSWEETLGEDLGGLFGTAPLLKNISSTSVFKDIVSKNKDVRALFAPTEPLASSTVPVILYSFFDNQKLIITDSFETLQTLIDRLNKELLVH